MVVAPIASAERATSSDDSLQAVGLTTSQRLVSFAVDRPETTDPIGSSGLQDDRRLIGIDYRVQDGQLYGVGNSGGIYTLDDSDATATKVSQLTVALDGTNLGWT